MSSDTPSPMREREAEGIDPMGGYDDPMGRSFDPMGGYDDAEKAPMME